MATHIYNLSVPDRSRVTCMSLRPAEGVRWVPACSGSLGYVSENLSQKTRRVTGPVTQDVYCTKEIGFGGKEGWDLGRPSGSCPVLCGDEGRTSQKERAEAWGRGEGGSRMKVLNGAWNHVFYHQLNRQVSTEVFKVSRNLTYIVLSFFLCKQN